MMPGMDAPWPRLQILPGTMLVLFVVAVQHAATVLSVPAHRFCEGLRAACALLSFGELHREDERLDELLPWAGNV